MLLIKLCFSHGTVALYPFHQFTLVFEVDGLTPFRLYNTSVAYTTELGLSPSTQVHLSFVLIN